MIDFGKTVPWFVLSQKVIVFFLAYLFSFFFGSPAPLTHSAWTSSDEVTRDDGYLLGLDNLVQLLSELSFE